MLTWTARLAAVLVLSAAAGTAGACEASRIPTSRINALVKTMGGESFQMDPSTVIARLTFTAPDAPPSIETLYAGGDARYAQAILAEAALLRTPCVTAGAPVQSLESHRVSVRQGRAFAPEPRLKTDLQLGDVVRLVRDLKSQNVKFDLREMHCPFAVRFSPFQPYMANSVHEVGDADPSRAPFLEWLRNVSLNIPKDMMVTAIGRESVVAVPCAVLDLS